MMEAEIRGIPNGVYRGEAQVYFDGKTPGSQYTIRVKITVEDERITFDYSDTDAQTDGFVNGTYTSSASASVLTFLQMVNPLIPHNEGMVEPIDSSSSRRARSSTPRTRRRPLSATTSARRTPTRSSARWPRSFPSGSRRGGTSCSARCRPAGTPKNDDYVDILFMGLKGGSGAMCDCDGYDHIGMIDASGGVLDQDYEMFEQQTPHRLCKHEYLTDSAGAGQFRGGLGVETRYIVGGENTQIVTFGDGDIEPAFGVNGGQGLHAQQDRVALPRRCEVHRPTTKDLVSGVPTGTLYVQEAGAAGARDRRTSAPRNRCARRSRTASSLSRPRARSTAWRSTPRPFEVEAAETARLRGEA